ncbi:unnamed protein product [Clonostachys byssicola]|uniref:Cell wall protein PhiA n=1 Tax=Clonostachys byssicola TaxID=160290 RepID=A0A9N9UDT2_9HYPO|nr:unnamed protein product [Clonostachys byssicola]
MKTFAVASLAAAAAAMPGANEARETTNSDITNFEILPLRSASDIHFARISAAKSSLFAKLPEQDASCLAGVDGNQPAAFQINSEDKTLWLYASGNPRQQIYVDRSGMGQGKIGYTTGAEPAPRNAEREGWVINADGNLQFNGTDLTACPNSIDGAWSIWLSGASNPGGNEGCLGFSARAGKVEKPNDCQYTS